MSCEFCTELYSISSSPYYRLCAPCYSALRGLISLINIPSKSDRDGGGGSGRSYKKYKSTTSRVLADCLTWATERKDEEEYLGGFVDFFKQNVPADIQILPGGNHKEPISAHRTLLASRSKVFNNMLSSDEIMASENDEITLHEFTHEELDCFVELIYYGKLAKEKFEKHLHALAIASHKYEIPLMANICERKLLNSLNTNNALEVLEISHTCSMQKLKEFTLNFILQDTSGIISPNFYQFPLKNPHLSVEINMSFARDREKLRYSGPVR